MASLNRFKPPPPQKSNTYRNEYEFCETIAKIIFGQFVLILVDSYPFEYEYELTKMSTNRPK